MQEILNMINGMSPYLLLGFLLAGLMHAYVPAGFYSKYLSGKSFRSVFNAALLGIPLPLCSCGVIPTAMSLRKEGASYGAVVSFLIATPQTGMDSIMATYGLMGLPFAIVRPVVALITALFGGFATDKFTADTPSLNEEKTNSHSHEEHCCCHKHEEEKHCHCHEQKEEEHCCCHKHEEEEHCCCHKHEEEEHCCHKHEEEEHCHCHSHEGEAPKGFWGKLLSAIRYAYVDMMEDIGKWLFIGLVVAALITVFVPTEFFAIFQGNTFASMLLVLCIAIPMYVCATGSIPIAVALMMKGLTPGAALVLLMAGPACNIASILVIRKSLGQRAMLTYIVSIVIGAIVFGCLIDTLQFMNFVDFTATLRSASCHTSEGSSLFGWICSGLLVLMLLNALLLPKLGLRKKKACCHNH